MSNNTSAFIFIPDISGYTAFVNDTELAHSQHIISELLEIIINSDKLGLTVSEIEGDAILSYKLDAIPAVEDIIDQCKQTFINFHNYIRRYESERICRCGACKTAVNLTLKFVVHCGELEILKVKEHESLHGSDVILAHRLLKNSVPDNEYILLSEKFKPESAAEYIDLNKWVNITKGSSEYDSIGKVDYNFLSLSSLHDQVKEPDPITIPGLGPDRITLHTSIQASVNTIYENFTNFEKRIEWNEEIKDIIGEDNLNKAGSMHTCLVGQNSLNIQTVGRVEDDEKIVYGERLDNFKGLKDIVSIYTFEKLTGETKVKVDIDFKPNSFIMKLFRTLVRKMIAKQNVKALKKLKIVSESNV